MATTIRTTPEIETNPSRSRPKLLFLDDRTKRIEAARVKYQDRYQLTIVTNVIETLRFLSREDWDYVSLDHDLGGIDFADPDLPTCGMEVVRYIEKTGWPAHKPRPEWWIHSTNLFAAHLLAGRLIALGMTVYQLPFIYDEVVKHMKYDAEGNPI